MSEKFISFSGGVESSTMCLLFGHKANAIFADTGAEHDEMYQRLDFFEKEIKKIHDPFEIIKVKNEKEGGLKDYIKKHHYFPSYGSRFCTRLFKIEPIDNFLKQFKKCELMIGLNVDEQRTGNYGLLENVNYTYPLQDYNITRGMCIKLLSRFGLEPAFPPYMQRGGCDICYFKSKKEWKAFILLQEKKAYELADFEESVQDIRDKYFAINNDLGKLRDFIEAVKAQGEMFEMEQTYPSYADNHAPCGAFCHR